MPLFDYQCDTCGKVHEDLFEPPVCCGVVAARVFPLVSRTRGRWGEDTSYYSHALGCQVSSRHEADKIAESRGLVPLADVGGETRVEEELHKTYLEQQR